MQFHFRDVGIGITFQLAVFVAHGKIVAVLEVVYEIKSKQACGAVEARFVLVGGMSQSISYMPHGRNGPNSAKATMCSACTIFALRRRKEPVRRAHPRCRRMPGVRLPQSRQWRRMSDMEYTVQLLAQDESSLFHVPATVTFAAGETETMVEITFDSNTIPAGKTYPVTVRIGDGGGDRGARIIVAGGAERFVALYFCVGYRQSEHV